MSNSNSNTASAAVVNQGVLGNAIGGAVMSPGSIFKASNPNVTMIGQQMEMFPAQEFQLGVTKAENGWVVRISRGPGFTAATWVVAADQKLTDVIAAAIVAHKLEAA